MDVDEQCRRELGVEAARLRKELAARGVRMVAVTFVDNSGLTRVKAVPLDRLEAAAAWGIGVSPCFDAFLFNDVAVSGRHTPGVMGDLRLHPDLGRLTALAAQPGWAWAPADRYALDGSVHEQDQRSLARSATRMLAEAGYTARAAFEVEWALGRADAPDDGFAPAVSGPAYGAARLVERSDYLADIAAALGEQGVTVDQIHPEYGAGQFEVSVASEDPVGAADTTVLVRQTIRAVSLRHGFRVSLSPKVITCGVGNGGHVHLSTWSGGSNTFSGGDGPFGLTSHAEAFTAGILHRLPALLAVGAPSVASYLRLVPQHWAGAFAAWGLENRETALRLVTGPEASASWSANLEVKCFDQSANPYLAIAALIFAGLAGAMEGARLPEPVDRDPATLDEQDRQRRGIYPLPASLAEAVAAFEADDTLRRGFGQPLTSTIVDIRNGEIAHFDGASPEEITAALRWVH